MTTQGSRGSSRPPPTYPPVSFENRDELLEDARVLFSHYEHGKKAYPTTRHEAAALPLFVRAYALQDQQKDFVTKINPSDKDYRTVKSFNSTFKSFFETTDDFWKVPAIREQLEGIRVAALETAKEDTRKGKGGSSSQEEDGTTTDGKSMAELLRMLVEHQMKAPTVSNNASGDRFRTDWIGLFQPDVETFGGDTVSQGDKLVFRDVGLFTENAIRAGATHGDAFIASRLHLCLRGTAFTWFTTLDQLTQECLALNLHQWRDLLLKRFQISLTEAGGRFDAQRYTIQDVRMNRPPYDYVLAIERYSRVMKLPSYVSVSKAWRAMDVILRQDIPEPSLSSELIDLAEQMRIKLPLWQELYLPPTYAPRVRYSPPSQSHAWHDDPAIGAGYAPQDRQQYGSNGSRGSSNNRGY